MVRTRTHDWTFGSGVFALIDSGHGVLIHLRSLDGVSLQGDGGDVGQVMSRWAAVNGSSTWLTWRGEDHRGARRGRSRRGRGRRRFHCGGSFNGKKFLRVRIQRRVFHLRCSDSRSLSSVTAVRRRLLPAAWCGRLGGAGLWTFWSG